MVMVHIFILKYHATNLDVEKIIWMYYCENNFLERMENDYIIKKPKTRCGLLTSRQKNPMKFHYFLGLALGFSRTI